MAGGPERMQAARPPTAKRGIPRNLLWFWGAVAVITGGAIGVLEVLGPPPLPIIPAADVHHGGLPQAAAQPMPMPPLPKAPAPVPAAMTRTKPPILPPMAVMGTGSTLAVGAAIPPPIPVLLAPSATNPEWLVPQIGATGLTPMRAYAASASVAQGPHVALLVSGIGDDDGQSQEAVRQLPAAVSLAITPYGQHIADIAAQARAAGHEILVSIPMQEADPAAENAGNEALVMAGPITQDQPMLDWSLSQFQGYVGVTDAIGVTLGDGFMSNPSAKAWLLQEVADKGLFFVDAGQSGALPYAWNRTADVVIDPVQAPQDETAQLAQLAADAKVQGNALGVLLNPLPTALQTLANWTQTLGTQGITLVPVSALVLPPNDPSLTPTPAAAMEPAAPRQVTAVTP